MKQEVASVKTITEIQDNTGDFVITCFGDIISDGSTRPSIFKAQLPNEPKTIDNNKVLEGELALSYEGDTVGELNKDGELIIEPQNDDPDKYRIENQDLKYDE